MTHPKIDLALVGRLVRRRWHALVALALLGALLGYGLSFVLSPGYVSASKILLQGERDKDQLPGESEVATSSVVLDRVAQTLGWGVTGRDLRDRVTAVVDLNVIQISGSAESPERARQLTDQVTTQYVIFSAQISGSGADPVPQRSPDELQRGIDAANSKIRQLRASPSANAPDAEGGRVRTQIERAQGDLRRALEDLSRAGRQNGATLSRSSGSVIEPATLPTAPASPSTIELIAAGALALAAVGVFGHLLRLRLDARLWEPEEVAAALGTPVLGRVEGSGAPNRAAGRRGPWRDDLRWSRTDPFPAGDGPTRQARYTRALRNLRRDLPRAGEGPEVLVLTVNGDSTALSAVTELVSAAAADGPVRLVGEDRGLLESVLAGARERGMGAMVSAGPPLPRGLARTTFEVVVVSPLRPRVPEGVGASRAVVVLTLGTLTGLELAALGVACTEADRRLFGAVLVAPRVTRPGRAPAEPARGASDPATAGAGAS